MDLQVYLIIVTVFFVSLGSLLFVNRQLRGGKTFEEALAEKRQLTEKLYGSKKKNAAKKANTGKKNRKDGKDAKQQQKVQQHSAVESDGKSDSGSEVDSNALPASNDGKAHVEFTEEQIIAPETNTVQFKRQLSTGKVAAVRKTSTSKSPGSGILLNKMTTAKPAPSANGTIETLNHFEKIHPKDDLEIKKQRDESVGRTVNKKENKKGKPTKKDSSPSNTVAEKPTNAVNDAVDAHLPAIEVMAAQVVAAPKESPKNVANKEKPNKKKRNDALLIQQLVDAGVASSTSDAVNVNAIIQQLGNAELTRGEIQILIDFLLNKQQDTASVTHSDWSDDPLRKLRNQLEEKDRQLAEEQKAVIAIQTKLRELRAELNAERAQATHSKSAHIEELNALKADLQQIQQDRQLCIERANNEKQALNKQLQHLQQKMFQEKNAQTQEQTQQIQQLTEKNAQLASDLLNQQNIIKDMQEKFLQIRDEHLNKMTECEQKYQDLVRKNEQDLAYSNGEILRLRTECQRNDELEKQYAMKTFEFEQLELRLNEQNKQSNQIEDSSKVEIRNLQNALDSTKTELTQSRTELATSSKRIDELNMQLNDLKSTHDTENSTVVQTFTKQIDELNSTIQSYRTIISEKDAKLSELQTKLENASVDQREQELFKQIADYKEKNNELRKKNWKLIDALQKAEESAVKISSKCNLVTTSASLSPSKITAPAPPAAAAPSNNDIEHEHILRTKQVFERLFPNVPSTNVDYDTWLANLTGHIEQQQQQQQQSQQNHLKQKSTIASSNHQNGGDDGDSASEVNITGNGTNHHAQDNGKLSPNDELMIQNAKLKSIVAETSEILTALEKKATSQDAYWRSVVQLKDNEIRSLQQNSVPST